MAAPRKKLDKNRLTTAKLLKRAKSLAKQIDPSTPEGKHNLEQLDDFKAREQLLSGYRPMGEIKPTSQEYVDRAKATKEKYDQEFKMENKAREERQKAEERKAREERARKLKEDLRKQAEQQLAAKGQQPAQHDTSYSAHRLHQQAAGHTDINATRNKHVEKKRYITPATTPRKEATNKPDQEVTNQANQEVQRPETPKTGRRPANT